jgi:hypothetical protein
MNKFKLVAVAAVLAAPITAVVADTAEARRPGLNRLFRVQHTLRAFRKPTVYVYRRSTTYREYSPSQRSKQRQEAATTPKKPAQKGQSAGAGVRQVDARGRVYDPGSMVWFDGGNQCWTGTQPWTFKNNAWFYGDSRWYPSGGGWQADTADPPASVGCQTVPAFAALTPPLEEITRIEGLSDAPAAPKSETKSVQPPTSASPADNPANCRTYLAVIGETVAVPCAPSTSVPVAEPQPAPPTAKPEPAPAPVRRAEPSPPAPIAPAAAPAAAERTKEIVRSKAKRRAPRHDNDDD